MGLGLVRIRGISHVAFTVLALKHGKLWLVRSPCSVAWPRKSPSSISAQVKLAKVQVAGRSISPWWKLYGRSTIYSACRHDFFSQGAGSLENKVRTKMARRRGQLCLKELRVKRKRTRKQPFSDAVCQSAVRQRSHAEQRGTCSDSICTNFRDAGDEQLTRSCFYACRLSV